jgi:hypothetical protein
MRFESTRFLRWLTHFFPRLSFLGTLGLAIVTLIGALAGL